MFVPSLTWNMFKKKKKRPDDYYKQTLLTFKWLIYIPIPWIFLENKPQWQHSSQSWKAPLCLGTIQATVSSSPSSSSVSPYFPKFWCLKTQKETQKKRNWNQIYNHFAFMRYKNRATDSTVFTFSDSVVDDVIINIKAVCSKNADCRREAVVESAALNVWLFFCHLSPQKKKPQQI